VSVIAYNLLSFIFLCFTVLAYTNFVKIHAVLFYLISHVCIVLQHVHRPTVMEEMDELVPGSVSESEFESSQIYYRLHPLNGIGEKVDSVADPDKADEPHTVEDLHVSSGGDNYSEVAEVDKSYSELEVDSVADPDKADEPDTVEDLHVSSGGDNYSEVAEVDKSYSELEVDSVADPDKADEPDTVEDLHVSSGGDNSSEVAEVDKSYSELEVDSVADPDYDPASTHESTSQSSQDSDDLIVSKSVKEVRPFVAEHIDNDHRRDEPDMMNGSEVTGTHICLFACVYVQSC